MSRVASVRPTVRARRAAAVVLGATLMMVATPTVTSAAPWTATYDWQGNSRTGYENWAVEETVPDSGQPLPFYRTYLGGAPSSIGRGLAIQPLGGRVYDNGNPMSQEGGPGMVLRWKAPGASRVTRARYDDLRYRNEGDGQYMRARVFGGSDDIEDYGPDYGEDDPDRTYNDPSPEFDRSPVGGGTTAEFWLFTVCGPNGGSPAGFACPSIDASTGTFARVGSTVLTLDDPDKPTVQVTTNPDITDGWVNKKRAQRLSVSATDPSSGIKQIRVQATNSTGGSGGRTILDDAIRCDPLHRTAGRGGLNCPPTANASKTDPASAQGSKGRTYTVTATDDAGNVSEPVIRRIRYDDAKPTSASIGGELKGLLDAWTNRRGTVPVTVRASDALSGVARVELLAQRVAGGRSAVLAEADVACIAECRSVGQRLDADLDQITRDGRYRIQVRVTDRAGNRSRAVKVPGQLKIDRTAPRASGRGPFYVDLGNGHIRVYVPAGRNEPESAGLGNFVVRFSARDDDGTSLAITPRVHRVQADKVKRVKVKKQRFRAFTVSGADTTRPVDGPETACDSARGGPPRAELDGEVGNCPRVVVFSNVAARGPSFSLADCGVAPGAAFGSVTIDARGTAHTFAQARVLMDGYVRCRGNRKYDRHIRSRSQTLSLSAEKPTDLPPDQALDRSSRLSNPVALRLNNRRYFTKRIAQDCVPGPLKDNGRDGYALSDVTYRIGINWHLYAVRPRNGVALRIRGSGANSGKMAGRCDAVGMWQIRGYEDVVRYKNRRGTKRLPDPATLLGRRLGSKPAKTGWAAHHIIPVYDLRLPSARQIEQLGYVCRIAPNSADNGIWVRTARHKAFHGRNADAYYKRILRAMKPAIRDGYCNPAVAVRAIQAEVRK